MSYHLTEISWEPGQGFDPRTGMVFSDATKIRLHPQLHKVMLKRTVSGKYPTTANLHIQSRTYSPTAVRLLKYLQLFADVPEGTSVGFRLYDGTDVLWWSGTDWEVPDTDDWNTEAEINANLATFPVAASRQFAVVLNLVTTDQYLTPTVSMVRVAWEGDVDEIDDVLVDGLTAKLQDGLSWVEDAPLPPTNAITSTIDLTEYNDEQGILGAATDVEAVYDHTSDPDHLVNLLSSYDTGTKVITLTGALALAKQPWLRLVVPPLVAYDTDADFSALPRLPAVELQRAEVVSGTQHPGDGVAAGDKETGAAIEFPAPYRMTYRIRGELITDGTARRPLRISKGLITLVQSDPFVHAPELDTYYRLQLVGGLGAMDIGIEGKQGDIRRHAFELKVYDVLTPARPATTGYIVKQVECDITPKP